MWSGLRALFMWSERAFIASIRGRPIAVIRTYHHIYVPINPKLALGGGGGGSDAAARI